MSEVLLKIRDLQIDYKTDLETVHAVNGVSLTLNKGETLILSDKGGKILAAVTEPDIREGGV